MILYHTNFQAINYKSDGDYKLRTPFFKPRTYPEAWFQFLHFRFRNFRRVADGCLTKKAGVGEDDE